ncbi:MAG: MotA/TolQ/ExbB proton channel family protein [Simkaniaceae bacterium]
MNSLSIIMQAFALSDFLGKLIFTALFSLSIISWYVLLTKILYLKKMNLISTGLKKLILEKRDRLLEVPKERLKAAHPFGSIYLSFRGKTLEILEKNHYFSEGKTVFLSSNDMDLIESSVLSSIGKEAKRLEKNLFVLSTVVTLAPFLGLLGTVWGILITFSELQKGGVAASNQFVLGGLATALATTVLGLLIAIPALIGHSYLKNVIRQSFHEMEEFGSRLLSMIEIQYRKVEG